MSKDIEFTLKQQRFCEEYVIDMNGTQAAIRAGYSKHTAAAIACENLIKPYIRSHIQKLITERNIRIDITVDIVIQEILKIALADKCETTFNKLKALEMLLRYMPVWDKRESEPDMPIQQKIQENIPEDDRKIVDSISPIERERLRKALEQKILNNTGFGKDEANEQKTG
jgi:phage terminase small subunit